MPQVKRLAADAPKPKGNFVEIVRVPGGKFSASGSIAYVEPKPWMVEFTPPAFDSLDEAIQASTEWATAHSIPYIYVREAADAPRP